MLKLISNHFAISKANVLTIAEEITQEHSPSRVFIVLEIAGENARTVKNKLIEIFQTSFFNNEEEVLFRFEECMKQVNEFLHEHSDEMNGIIAVQDRSELHISQTGKGETYLIRKGKLNVIIENIGQTEEAAETFTSIASGELLIDDKIIFSTLRVLRYATASQITSVLSEGIAEGIDAIRDLVQLETQCGAVLCFHTKGASIFTQEDKIHHFSYKKQSPFDQALVYFEKGIAFISEKTKKPYDTVQNIVFGVLGGLFIVILIAGVAMASINNKEQQKYEQYKTEMLKIEKELQIAETRAQMNEVDSANAILDKIEKSVSQMLTEGMFVDEGLVIMERIQKQKDTANNIFRFSNLADRVLASFKDKLAQNEALKGIISLQGEIYAFSNSGIYKTVLNHVEPKVNISEGDDIVQAETIPDRNSLLFTLSSGALKEFLGGQVSNATTEDATFKTAIAQAPYGRFVYFLSPQDNQIYKYERKREGFTKATAWLTNATDLKDAIDLAIDGSIYVLKKGGGVALFHKGEEMSVALKGGKSDLLTTATQIFVEPDMQHVYFLNPERSSIISYKIANKSLEFFKEYVIETPSKMTDFYVDKDEKRMVISDENTLYEITL